MFESVCACVCICVCMCVYMCVRVHVCVGARAYAWFAHMSAGIFFFVPDLVCMSVYERI